MTPCQQEIACSNPPVPCPALCYAACGQATARCPLPAGPQRMHPHWHAGTRTSRVRFASMHTWAPPTALERPQVYPAHPWPGDSYRPASEGAHRDPLPSKPAPRTCPHRHSPGPGHLAAAAMFSSAVAANCPLSLTHTHACIMGLTVASQGRGRLQKHCSRRAAFACHTPAPHTHYSKTTPSLLHPQGCLVTSLA